MGVGGQLLRPGGSCSKGRTGCPPSPVLSRLSRQQISLSVYLYLTTVKNEVESRALTPKMKTNIQAKTCTKHSQQRHHGPKQEQAPCRVAKAWGAPQQRRCGAIMDPQGTVLPGKAGLKGCTDAHRCDLPPGAARRQVGVAGKWLCAGLWHGSRPLGDLQTF